MRSQKNIGLVLLLYIVLATVMTLPLSFHLKGRIASDLGDPLFFVWALDWEIHSLRTGFKDFWNGNIFYPHRGVLLYADYFPAQLLFGLPILLLTNNLIVTYNLLFILSFILAAFGMYLLARYLIRSESAAFIAGLIFAFCPYRLAHISHLELLSSAWIPLCFLFLLRFFDNPSYGNLAGIGVFFVLQFLSCAYYGVFLSLFVGLFIFYFSYKKGFFRRKDFWLKMALLVSGCFLILFPLFYPYIPVHERMMLSRDLREVEFYSAQVQHFLQVPPWNSVWGKFLARSPSPEWQRYPGIVVIFLVLFWVITKQPSRRQELRQEKTRLFFWWDLLTGFYLLGLIHILYSGGFTLRWGETRILSVHKLTNPLLILAIFLFLRFWLGWRWRNRRPKDIPTVRLSQRFFLFSCFFAWLLALGPVIRFLDRPIIAGPYSILYNWFPVFQGLRAPSRFSLFMMMALALFSGWAMEVLVEKQKSGRMKKAIPVLVSLLILVDYASLPLPTQELPWAKKFPAIYSVLRQLPAETVVIELPMPVKQLERGKEAIPMFYSTFHRKKLVNGYSGYEPPGYSIIYESMEDFPSAESLRLLEDLGVNYVLLHTNGFRKEKGQWMHALMESFAERVKLEASAEGDYLYRLLPREKEKIRPRHLAEVGDRRAWTAWSSSNVHDAKKAIDGDLATGWTSRLPQRPGEFFFLDLGEIYLLEELELSHPQKPLNYAHGFIVEGSLDQKNWFLLNETPFFIPRLTRENIENFREWRMVISFDAARVRYLRIRLTRSHPVHHWSIQEIRCYGPAG